MDKLREFLLIVTSILTIGGVIIKIFHNFFFEIIKIGREPIPGKQSIYELGTMWGMISIVIFSVITYIKELFNKLQQSNKELADIMYALAIILFIFVWIAIIMVVWIIYSKVTEEYINYLNNENNGKKKPHRKYKLKLWFIAVLSCVYSDLWILAISTSDIKTILIIGIFGISSIIIFILSFNLMGAIRDIDNVRTTNMIYTHKEVICCKSFLECGEYYRIFEDGIERFIKKSEVKEIRKIDVDKIQHDKVKNSIKEIINGLIENTNKNLES